MPKPVLYNKCFRQFSGKKTDTRLLDNYARVADKVTMISFDRLHELGIHHFRALLDTQPSLQSVDFQTSMHSNAGLHHVAAQLLNPVVAMVRQSNKTISKQSSFGILKQLQAYVVKQPDAFPTYCIDAEEAVGHQMQEDYEWCKQTSLHHRDFTCEDFLRHPAGKQVCFLDTKRLWAAPLSDFWEEIDRIGDLCSKNSN